MKNCLVIGDLNVDLIVTGIQDPLEKGSEVIAQNHFLVIGGSGGVFSAVLSELGIKTYIASKINDDLFGNYLIQKLESHGAGTDRIAIEKDNNTGITINLSFADDKIQISSVEMVNNFNIKDIDFKTLNNIDHVHFSSYYMMDSLQNDYIEIINRIKKINENITFSMDTNDDPLNEWNSGLYGILPYIDIFLINRKEALLITREDDVYKALRKLGKMVETVAVKLGPEGYIAIQNDHIFKDHSLNADFKDSTGAGDNFDAGFIYGFLNNMGMEKSLQVANICGSVSVEYFGGAGVKEKFIKIKKMLEELE